MHTPIVWSDRRPTDKEFRDSFGATKLSAQKILDFMHQRQSVIQKVVLTNSEGYWSGEYCFILSRRSGCWITCHLSCVPPLPPSIHSARMYQELIQADLEDSAHCLKRSSAFLATKVCTWDVLNMITSGQLGPKRYCTSPVHMSWQQSLTAETMVIVHVPSFAYCQLLATVMVHACHSKLHAAFFCTQIQHLLHSSSSSSRGGNTQLGN